MSAEPEVPDFGEGVAHASFACTPRELYVALLDVEEHVHYLEPAYRFATAALARVDAPTSEAEPEAFVRGLVDDARAEARSLPFPAAHAGSWPARVARELAPAGLGDGAWLHGAVRANVVEDDRGMSALAALMVRFGDPGARESHSQRYASLLQSIGVVPATIARYEPEGTAPCADVSYEHALLGLAIGCFPVAFAPETLGFDLWMATVGPSPLLERLRDALHDAGADTRYLDRHDRRTLERIAVDGCVAFVARGGSRERLARGFLAARRSDRRWSEAMCGRNVPLSPRDFVLEAVRRKSAFAVGHHGNVRLGDALVEDLFRGGAHEELLDRLAASPYVRPGNPGESRLLTRSITIDGPMFDVFTAGEKRDLREWIASLPGEARPRPEPVALEGSYGPPQDHDALLAHAVERYGAAPEDELCYYLANADRYPAARLFGRLILEQLLEKLRDGFAADPKLGGTPPRYSERLVAEMVEERHRKNLASRGASPSDDPAANAPPSISMVFDGAWLQGFADVHRSDREEYGWMFRIYASEQGDGDLAWNHNRINRLVYEKLGRPETMLPATDRRLYQYCMVSPTELLELAASLNTRRFMPELLGINLGIEAYGVGGKYVDGWKANEHRNPWAALTFRLHNAIDNYASGHTKWSLAAVQAFMSRVIDAAPESIDSQWQRIWRIWRVQEILGDGIAEERDALNAALGVVLTSLAPTSI